MTFGEALDEMKMGRKVQRAGWNGKGMWVALTPGSTFPLELAREGAAQHLADEVRATQASPPGQLDTYTITINPHLDMRAADGSLVVGWLASQTDMLAADWSVVP